MSMTLLHRLKICVTTYPSKAMENNWCKAITKTMMTTMTMLMANNLMNRIMSLSAAIWVIYQVVKLSKWYSKTWTRKATSKRVKVRVVLVRTQIVSSQRQTKTTNRITMMTTTLRTKKMRLHIMRKMGNLAVIEIGESIGWALLKSWWSCRV